jgi:hypothetical protein
MGLTIEFNDRLALRSIDEYQKGRRQETECIPEHLRTGETYGFLKQGQRVYTLLNTVPLVITTGNQKTSEPLADVLITEICHSMDGDTLWTTGKYIVVKVY